MPALNSTTNGAVQHPAELDVSFFLRGPSRDLTSTFLGFKTHYYDCGSEATTRSGVSRIWRGVQQIHYVSQILLRLVGVDKNGPYVGH